MSRRKRGPSRKDNASAAAVANRQAPGRKAPCASDRPAANRWLLPAAGVLLAGWIVLLVVLAVAT